MSLSSPGVCWIEDCGRAELSRGLCTGHRQRMFKGTISGDFFPYSIENWQPGTCAFIGCPDVISLSERYCATHHSSYLKQVGVIKPLADKRRNNGAICMVSTCERKATAKGLCNAHHTRRVNFGLTAEVLSEMLSPGRCDICGTSEDLVLDHDHACCDSYPTCGQCMRGLLCRTCNSGIAMFRDNVATVLRAARYLKETTPQP